MMSWYDVLRRVAGPGVVINDTNWWLWRWTHIDTTR